MSVTLMLMTAMLVNGGVPRSVANTVMKYSLASSWSSGSATDNIPSKFGECSFLQKVIMCKTIYASVNINESSK